MQIFYIKDHAAHSMLSDPDLDFFTEATKASCRALTVNAGSTGSVMS